MGRLLIVRLLVVAARKEKARAVAHGCTAKGNDQVRMDVGIAALAPELEIIAPAREWKMTREQTIKYAQAHNISVPVTKASPIPSTRTCGAVVLNAVCFIHIRGLAVRT